MDQVWFIGLIGIFLLIVIVWGFKILPGEKWQIMAVIPGKKTVQEEWTGLNLTYYGLLCANAYTFAVVMFFILGASARIPLSGLCVLILAVLAVCTPASKVIARLVEKKSGTLTVGGAVFTGILLSPGLVYLVNLTMGRHEGFHISAVVFMSAVCVSYAYGEGLGRLACISFGCCYGKPLHQCSGRVQKLFSGFNLVFRGKTRKIVYASGLEGEKVIPIQVITAGIYSVSALAGTALFLDGHYEAALLETLLVTQVWRFVSEFFRADFRGLFRITPYQLMSATGVLYVLGVVALSTSSGEPPRLQMGLNALWNPWMVFLIEFIWLVAFFHTGRSVVTGAKISFHVNQNRI